jgi:hypothetical protein
VNSSAENTTPEPTATTQHHQNPDQHVYDRWMSETWPKDEVAAEDERTTLLAFLGHQRRFLIRKASGLTEEEVRIASCPPSDLTLLGLVRHAADVERGWAKRGFAGIAAEPLFYSEQHPDGDFHPPAEATMATALEALRAEAGDADAIYSGANLGNLEKHERGFYTLRWILVHLIEEYARHLGHADLIREAIDGQTGE